MVRLSSAMLFSLRTNQTVSLTSSPTSHFTICYHTLLYKVSLTSSPMLKHLTILDHTLLCKCLADQLSDVTLYHITLYQYHPHTMSYWSKTIRYQSKPKYTMILSWWCNQSKQMLESRPEDVLVKLVKLVKLYRMCRLWRLWRRWRLRRLWRLKRL